MLSEEVRAQYTAILQRYKEEKSALLPALHLAQRRHGYLSEEAMQEVATAMNLPITEIGSVTSFYTMYNRQPVGRYLVQVCTNISCSLRDAEEIVAHLKQTLGIAEKETTADSRFTLMTVECLGACGGAPMMQINDDYYENLTIEKVDEILAGLP